MIREEIPPSEYTFDNAVQKIIELNEIWDPKFIYVDAGSGEYQIEYLRKYGSTNPESGLQRKIKRVQFAENLEIVDPVTGQVDKKQAKDFMINQTSILLDRHMLSLSGFDDEFITQMTNYRVLGKTASGRNVYSDEDHIIDSYMLSLLGFILNYPELLKTIFMRKMSTKVNYREDVSVDNIKDKLFDTKTKKKDNLLESADNPNWGMKKLSPRKARSFARSSFQRGSSSRRRASSFRRSTF